MLYVVAGIVALLLFGTLTTAVLTLGVRTVAGLLIDVPLGIVRLLLGKWTGRD